MNKNNNKKLEMLAKEFNNTVNHAAEILNEFVDELTVQILVDAFNELSVEDQMLVLLGMVCETQPKVEENKTAFDFSEVYNYNLDYTWEALQRRNKRRNNHPYSYDAKVIEALLRMEGIKL